MVRLVSFSLNGMGVSGYSNIRGDAHPDFVETFPPREEHVRATTGGWGRDGEGGLGWGWGLLSSIIPFPFAPLRAPTLFSSPSSPAKRP